jgi:adenylate cyclase
LGDEFAKAMENMNEIPIVSTMPKQFDSCTYLKERKSEILNHWNEKYIIGESEKPAEKLLEELEGKESYIAVLYVDMEGSTRLSSQVDSETYTKIMKIFLMQMAKIIDNFRGYVLKFVGDCVIGIFLAEGNFPNTCDNSVQAAMLMCSTVEDVINPILIQTGLPEIGFHIGVDIGLVRADKFGALDIASFNDLIGYTMNLTAKIQSKAGHNEILIGRQLYELIHNSWQVYCSRIDLGDGWKMEDPRFKATYEVYKFSAKWVCKCSDK